jgi:hypothetical protein
MPERLEHSLPKKVEPAIRQAGQPDQPTPSLERDVYTADQGSHRAEAEKIARLLGHNDPAQVEEWIRNQGKGSED